MVDRETMAGLRLLAAGAGHLLGRNRADTMVSHGTWGSHTSAKLVGGANLQGLSSLPALSAGVAGMRHHTWLLHGAGNPNTPSRCGASILSTERSFKLPAVAFVKQGLRLIILLPQLSMCLDFREMSLD